MFFTFINKKCHLNKLEKKCWLHLRNDNDIKSIDIVSIALRVTVSVSLQFFYQYCSNFVLLCLYFTYTSVGTNSLTLL